MTGADERIIAEAVAWHLASERDDMDWVGFTAWLEADPQHRAAFDEIALTDAALVQHREALAPIVAITAEEEQAPGRTARRWPLWTGGAIAASLVAVLAVPQLISLQPLTYASDGVTQDVTLADGSRVELAPHSRLTVSGRNGQQLALEGGAYFAIRHDPARTLTISAGGLEIGDIGTSFDVQATAQAVRIAVSEGRVEVSGEALGKRLELPAGQRILYDPAHHMASVAQVAAGDVGGWRQGRLSYDAAPLSLVASDLARYAGVTVSVPPALGERRFSGTLSIRNGKTAVRDLAQLMGLELSRDAGAYRLADPG